MDHRVDPLARQTEEEVRLDHLEALVHHRRRIDRDLRAHLPRRMRERVVDGDRVEGLEAPLAEGAARGREHEAAGLAGRARAQGLVDRAVLGVDRDQLGAALLRLREDELARHDERLLVREGQALAGPHRGPGRTQPQRAHESPDDRVRVRMAGGLVEAFHAGHDPAAEPGRQHLRKARNVLGAVDRDELRPELRGLLGELFDRAPGGERHHPEPVRHGCHHVERRAADRAGRAQNREGFHEQRVIILRMTAERVIARR